MKPTSIRHQRGITLLESMVAIVVMALGILGVLGVQLRTLADTQTSVRRAQAVRLIEDLSERIKVNPDGLNSMGNYVTAWNAAVPAAPVDCTSVACNSTNLAKYDLSLWLTNVRSTMPLGDASVFLVADETDASNRRQLGVMMSWRENEREHKKADGTVDTNYTAGIAPAGTGGANVNCPTDRICHLQYIQVISRCAPYTLGGASSPQVFCP
jgi:type IV pilus assembly protein PilV